MGEVFEDVVHFNIVAKAGEEFDCAFWAIAGVVAVFEVCAVSELF